MEAQPVDDLVDDLALGAEGDPDEVELVLWDSGHGGSIRLVVARLEQVRRVDGQGIIP
jgi:hypothetical protein